ncbi:GIY-YIG nuclease family protein [Bradyrhizobium sp.]|uniref:GIY-YIG nuclease family protein n=1 Tax=Bradyrhizobium sp. TaxID=376 RepID=UPI001ECA56B4|nr:GIY-YIG nuclease family protein [Bradyrhizobium sp.]MBV9983458.1 GIY-YIG nuclease family protein [Bradyrhizobium sp.]
MRDQILAEIRKLAAANNGKAPGTRMFESQTGIGEAAWRGRYWARWGDALVEAGFAPNAWQGKHESELVFQKFVEVCRHCGRIPTVDEIKMYGRGREGFPHAKALYGHFGSKDGLIQNLREWVAGKGELADVAAMLGEVKEHDQEQSKAVEGLVYLIKSGTHYKVGRSDELERRVKEIRVALPEAATLVHSIRTDDPAGIEAYWHRRFSDRRANGEWFRLTSSDVAAFKRRKFQ